MAEKPIKITNYINPIECTLKENFKADMLKTIKIIRNNSKVIEYIILQRDKSQSTPITKYKNFGNNDEKIKLKNNSVINPEIRYNDKDEKESSTQKSKTYSSRRTGKKINQGNKRQNFKLLINDKINETEVNFKKTRFSTFNVFNEERSNTENNRVDKENNTLESRNTTKKNLKKNDKSDSRLAFDYHNKTHFKAITEFAIFNSI